MVSRRKFLKLGFAAPGLVAVPAWAQPHGEPCVRSGQTPMGTRRDEFLRLAEGLLSQWCEGLLAHQIIKPQDPSVHGGFWSAGDGLILGRCADAVYPLLWYARTRRDERYVDAAVRVMNWSLANVALPDGSWKNESKGYVWQGITVFIAAALALAVRRHGDILDRGVREQWLERLGLSGAWLYNNIDINYGNINYPVANSYTMALLGQVLEEPKYTRRGRELARAALSWFTEKDGFFYGEGRNAKLFPGGKSKKGCYPVDLAYNVEESLPALVMFNLIEKDEEVLARVIEALRLHAEFMLPDGGWDNSWGTRNFKWTWWGSRTSDGCQPAYALLADRDPLFLEVAYRNTRLMQDCTKDGILYGGPHVQRHGSPASIHHTFCHAKALAIPVDFGIPEIAAPAPELPCEKSHGIRAYPDIATWVISHRPWRATITAYDFPYVTNTSHPSGGALSLLWHQKAGALLAASMSIFRWVEAPDMQNEVGPGFGTLTPRLEMVVPQPLHGRMVDWLKREKSQPARYMNILDMAADVDIETQDETIVVETRSRLVDENQQSPGNGNIPCRVGYIFTRNDVRIEASVESLPENASLAFFLPVISEQSEPLYKDSDATIIIRKKDLLVRVSADQPMVLPAALNKRIFSYVPGFEAIPIQVPLTGDKRRMRLRIEVLEVDGGAGA